MTTVAGAGNDSALAAPRGPSRAIVDLGAIRDNYRAIANHAGARTVIPVLKANAYGHGAVAVAHALAPLRPAMFAVAYVAEAIELRQAGVDIPVLVLTGGTSEEFSDLVEHNLTPVISSKEHLVALQALDLRGARPFRIHVKVDTGMSRLGFSVAELERALHQIEEMESVEIEGLMTHLASADEDAQVTESQLDLFDEAIARAAAIGVRPRYIHAANSAGLAYLRDTHTAVRPGLALYGVPTRPLTPSLPLRPALELRARVAVVRKVSAGTAVSYGGRFVAPRDMAIAILTIGYADGIPRTDAMRTNGFVTFAGKRLPTTGTVCMDLTMVDATEVPALKAGDEVTIFGGDFPNASSPWTVAEWAGTNAWHTLAALGPRVAREHKKPL